MPQLKEEKVLILKKHLIDQVPVSTVWDEYHLRPTVFYRWQKEFLENGAAAFQPRGVAGRGTTNQNGSMLSRPS